jgi:hypothetical protein
VDDNGSQTKLNLETFEKGMSKISVDVYKSLTIVALADFGYPV